MSSDIFDLYSIVSAGDAVSSEKDTLSILWAITKGCNFDCSYCVYKKSLRENNFSSKEQLQSAADKILRMGRPKYQITLYGGEPTLHPHFLDLVEYLNKCGPHINLRMFSNGSRSRAFFQQLADKVRGSLFGSIFSYHPEFAKFDRYIGAVEAMSAADLPVMVNYMFDPREREAAREHIDRIFQLRERHGFYVEINYTYNSMGVLGSDAIEADHAWIAEIRQRLEDLKVNINKHQSPNFCRFMCTLTIEQAGQRVVLNRESSLRLLEQMRVPSYEGYYCCSGANVFFIEETGDVRGGVCSASAGLGNIFTKSEINIVQEMKVIRCGSKACSSIENIPLPKFRSENEAEACVYNFKTRAKRYMYSGEAERLRREASAASNRGTPPEGFQTPT